VKDVKARSRPTKTPARVEDAAKGAAVGGTVGTIAGAAAGGYKVRAMVDRGIAVASRRRC
jgi:hypothetical protein